MYLRTVVALSALAAASALKISPVLGPPPPAPVQKLEQYYSGIMNQSCDAVKSHIPTLPAATVASFMQAYQAFNGSNSESEVFQLAGQLLAAPGVQAFLETAWTGGVLDTAMVRCAVIFDATPLGLAEYAVNGSTQENYVSMLLNDTELMRDMLLAGGPASGTRGGDEAPANYGQAMEILQDIYKASTVLPHVPKPPPGGPWDDRNQTTMLHRLALGTALGHAVPVNLRWPDPSNPSIKTVDPVERYLYYEKHYLAGDMDPALEVLTAFECRWTTNSDASSFDLTWVRDTMYNYRPENIAMDYSWRYAECVHTDVAYGDPACASLPGICNDHYWQIPAAGGECGPRAFFGRFTRKAFGVPTWGVTQPGHAAMTSWMPDGWRVLLGADWMYSWWGPRGGDDFHLETQCRELRPDYQKVLRGMWAANALGEAPVNQAWTPRSPKSYGQGGTWNALMLYAKKIAVNATTPPSRPIGPSRVPTKVDALIAKWATPLVKENITTDSAGNIHIPGTAYFYKNRTASMSSMWSADEGEQLLHNVGNYEDPASTSFSYAVTVDEDCTRYLTANHTTWHMNTDLLFETNTTTGGPVNVPVYYTVGYWNQTQPIEVSLLKGTNVLTFSRSSPAAIAFKEFFLYVNKPNVPPPNANHTTKPIPKPSDYIEVSAMTTCVKQGITDVPEKYCQDACEAVGSKYTGAKPRTNMTGCYALTSGQWAGNCNYNSNSSGVICDDPPCEVFGSVAQQICMRK